MNSSSPTLQQGEAFGEAFGINDMLDMQPGTSTDIFFNNQMVPVHVREEVVATEEPVNKNNNFIFKVIAPVRTKTKKPESHYRVKYF